MGEKIKRAIGVKGDFKTAVLPMINYSYANMFIGGAGYIISMYFTIFLTDVVSKKWTYNTRIHEYGHTCQCLLLGPLYYIVVAIPSAVWCNCFEGLRKKKNISYYWLYCEKWANAWGQKFLGMQQKGIK